MRLFLFLLLLPPLGSAAQSDVELVVSTGSTVYSDLGFSNDNKLFANLYMQTVSIWDVPTGRKIRTVVFSNDNTQASDTLWFSEDNSQVIIGARMNNNKFKVGVADGAVSYEEGPPFDYSNWTYQQSELARAGQLTWSNETKKTIFKSPDGKSHLQVKRVKAPVQMGGSMGTIYWNELKVKDRNGAEHQVESSHYLYYCFSEDSRLLFVNGLMMDMETGREISNSPFMNFQAQGIGFYPGTYIPMSSGTKSIRIWNFPTVEDIELDYLSNYLVSADGNYAVAEQLDDQLENKRISIVDLKEKKVLRSFKLKEYSQMLMSVDEDARRIAMYWWSTDLNKSTEVAQEVRVLDTENGKLLGKVKRAYKGAFSNKPNELVTDSVGSNGLFRNNWKTGAAQKYTGEDWGPYDQVTAFSSDNKLLLGYGFQMDSSEFTYYFKVWDMASGKTTLKAPLENAAEVPVAMAVSKNRKYAAASSSSNRITIYDYETGKKVFVLDGHTLLVNRLVFSDDGKRLLSSSLDGTVRLWNLETGKEMVALISIGEKDFAIVNPNQYYYATKGAQKAIHFVKGKEIFPFEQFDLKYNRPDIILESLEASNQDLVRPFQLAYQKRLKRMGYTEEMLGGEFHLPKVSVSNKDDLPLISDEKEIRIMVHAIDSKFLLDRLMIRVNGVPVHGKTGISWRGREKQLIKEEYSVTLSKGVNRIAVSVMNEKGVESIATNLDVEYSSSDQSLPALHLVTLGVSNYSDSQFDLSYAAKDAEDLTNLYASQHLPFSEVNSYHLKNDEVTLDKLNEIKEKLKESEEDDVVCLFFAGHGLLDQELNYFLAAHNVNFQNPEEGGIPYEAFEDLVDGIPARRKIVMIDACHSGEIDKEEVAWAENTQENNETEENMDFRAVTTTGFKQVGLTNSFELMKELFTDIRKSSGALIISSAGGTEYAMEGSDWNNGVFTYSLLSGMSNGQADLNQDGKVMAGELNEYVRNKVSELTAGRQTPTTRAEVLENDWRMW